MRSGVIGRLAGAILMMTTLLIQVSPARAASVEKLLMPGPVTQAHVKQEDTCGDCHDRHPNGRSQTELCLDCHKEIATNVRERKGFHGRMPNAGAGECRACHSEHKGRAFDIVQLNRTQFDHAQTDFALEGAHRALECASCHKPREKFSKAGTACIDCHKADDAHHGQFTQPCGECHSSISWAGGKFDHEKTDFHLTGAHVATSCNACHVGGHYKQTPGTCNGCHATDDEHRGSRGTDCGRCHTTKEWKTAKYDHEKETGFALLGVHDRIDCLACHRSGNYKDKIPKDCGGCHRTDDAHATRYGDRCGDCHDNEHWHPVEYDHLQRHHFALEGAHARIACDACHTAVIAKQKLGKTCNDCHKAEDPHRGRLKGGCDSCHGQKSWRSELLFDHDLTSYPLVGLHRVVSCAQCHATLAFADTPTTCIGCHEHEDVHHGGLGKKCESCHSTNGWSIWSFDHAKETHFPLLGAHAKLKCADCHHEAPGTSKTPSECVACHRKDDRHLGAYGTQCDRCHSSSTWKGARIQ